MGYRMTVMPKTGVKEFNKEREKKTKQMPLLSGVWCLLLSSTLRVVLVFFSLGGRHILDGRGCDFTLWNCFLVFFC